MMRIKNNTVTDPASVSQERVTLATPAVTDPHHLPLPFLPTERVWIMSDDRRAIETHVVRIEIDLRSVLTARYVPQQRITYILDRAVKRTDTEVFATKEDLLASL